MTDMKNIKRLAITAAEAAKALAEAEEQMERATEALKPHAKLQIELTQKVYSEMGLELDNYDQRGYRFYNWIELEVESICQQLSDIPKIRVKLWERGYGGDPDSYETTFILDEHIINSEPEKFEEKLRVKLGDVVAEQRQCEREQKELKIASLQAQLAKLQEAT